MKTNILAGLILLGFSSIGLLSCYSEPTKAPSSAEAQCIAKGGAWEHLTRIAIGCNMPYKDAGKVCTNSRDCESQLCFGSYTEEKKNTGHCAADTRSTLSSCRPKLENGKSIPRPCP